MGKLLESTDWRMQAYKGLVVSAWLGKTLKSIGWPRMSLGYSPCLSLPASPSFPSFVQVSTTFLINILHGNYISEPPFKGTQPSTVTFLSLHSQDSPLRAPGMTNIMAIFSAGFSSPMIFKPTGSRTRRESLKWCCLRIVQWPWPPHFDAHKGLEASGGRGFQSQHSLPRAALFSPDITSSAPSPPSSHPNL